ncbi:MAG: glycosyltransferase, partial [Clostridia bacterium]|nr:glycosyltransferase [Clostridia bacterium]
ILFLSRIVPEKGLRRLIQAFGRVKTGKRLVIAGGSSDTDAFLEELKGMAEGDDRLLFTGFVEGRVKHELYSNAYVYVLPSDLEGMPLSLLEAMCYGNCCLVSDIAECAEVVEDRAMTFRRGEDGDLARKLQLLCDSPELVEHYRREACAFICAKYSWEETLKRTLEVYNGHEAR